MDESDDLDVATDVVAGREGECRAKMRGSRPIARLGPATANALAWRRSESEASCTPGSPGSELRPDRRRAPSRQAVAVEGGVDRDPIAASGACWERRQEAGGGGCATRSCRPRWCPRPDRQRRRTAANGSGRSCCPSRCFDTMRFAVWVRVDVERRAVGRGGAGGQAVVRDSDADRPVAVTRLASTRLPSVPTNSMPILGGTAHTASWESTQGVRLVVVVGAVMVQTVGRVRL